MVNKEPPESVEVKAFETEVINKEWIEALVKNGISLSDVSRIVGTAAILEEVLEEKRNQQKQ